MKRFLRSPWLWIVLAVVAVLVALQYLVPNGGYTEVETSKMVDDINSGNVKEITFVDGGDQEIRAELDNGEKVTASWVTGQQQSIIALAQKGVDQGAIEKSNSENPQPSLLGSILATFLPFVLIILLFLFLMNQVQGGGGRVMQFAKSKAKLISKDMPKTTFSDVAGCQEAIEELGEIKEFLQEPAKFQAVGAKIPKGVLLYGPPGTGKTLLARAVAGEAGVPFYSISGSDFVEMFVGVGAARVRDLFEQAKNAAPAIVFIDEIDAVGRHRGAGMGGGHDEREQTLNQLLVEMDGFDVKGGVILIAATNRPDILDPALLRPGRFDRQIAVDRPDLEGRRAVLAVHAKGKPLAPDIELSVIARRTPGFTGADLANVINEAALLTARQSGNLIHMKALEEAIDRVIAGPERRTRAMSEKEKKVTAYHEGGHALVAWALPNLDPVHKVTILPRGRSLGHTLVLPTEDRYTQIRSEITDQLVYALGGRAAEELVFHEPTTGASNDIEKATALARAMITEYGMSAKLGAVKYGQKDSEPFLGRDYGHQRDYSETVATDIDSEVRQLIEMAHDEAWEILVEYRDVLDDLVLELMEKETLGKEDLARIFAHVAKRPPHNTYAGFGRRAPSDKPPVMTPAELRAVSTGRGPVNGAAAAPGMPSPSPRPAPAPAQYGANGAGRHATTPDGHPAQPGYGQPPYGTGQFAGGPAAPPPYQAQPGGQPPHQAQPHPGQAQPPYAGGQSGYGPEESSRGSGDNGQAGGYGQGWTPGDGQPGSR